MSVETGAEVAGGTRAGLFQSFRGSAAPAAEIIGDYRTPHQCTQCQQGAGHWGQQPGVLQQLLPCWSSALHLPTRALPGSEAPVDAGGVLRGGMKSAARPAKEAEEALTGVEKCRKERFLSPFFPPSFTASYTVNTGPGRAASYRHE